MNKQLVFVYGTLRKNQRNHHFLRNASCIVRECWTVGELYDSNLGYPFLVTVLSGRVSGELYQVDDIQLESLDHLEGYTGSAETNYYDRIEQLVKTDLGSFRALVYVLPSGKQTGNMERIESGDWCMYLGQC
ncbi:gamma-glutamylcyclotransferase [Bacillus sp. sid0103]|uniref:gamma-glutamylcyclotransferase family protein n=1 Tax=Bacillus sp. sid0103 TaxID=2856337 RepID=UPI001C46328D|nr:gamma-glutamylcyclotransferase [Bacillus sp. sid0103]MBV7504507.1 gamma-glutamylcyclotransferase [Bacillus sp. sid0103]